MATASAFISHLRFYYYDFNRFYFHFHAGGPIRKPDRKLDWHIYVPDKFMKKTGPALKIEADTPVFFLPVAPRISQKYIFLKNCHEKLWNKVRKYPPNRWRKPDRFDLLITTCHDMFLQTVKCRNSSPAFQNSIPPAPARTALYLQKQTEIPHRTSDAHKWAHPHATPLLPA